MRQWIMRTGNRLYAATIAKPGIQSFLLERTTPDRKMGEGLAKGNRVLSGRG